MASRSGGVVTIELRTGSGSHADRILNPASRLRTIKPNRLHQILFSKIYFADASFSSLSLSSCFQVTRDMFAHHSNSDIPYRYVPRRIVIFLLMVHKQVQFRNRFIMQLRSVAAAPAHRFIIPGSAVFGFGILPGMSPLL